MRKIGFIFIFIFLTGLFSGLFFSTSLSYENSSYLSNLLVSGFHNDSVGFFSVFFSALLSNGLLIVLMTPALLTKFFSPLPPAVLWYKAFAIGFCSSLIYVGELENAVWVSLLRVLPPGLFFIPGFIAAATAIFSYSLMDRAQKSRPSSSEGLLRMIAFAAALIAAGSITEAICHAIAL